MSGGERGSDGLDVWLSGEGRAALEGIFEGCPDVIGVLDRELKIRHVNWAAPGLTREGLVGLSVLELVPPEYQRTAREVYTRVLETGVPERFETMYADPSGLMIWSVRVGPVRAGGKIIGLIAVTDEVTAERREHADRDRFFSLSLDMLMVVTGDGRLKRLNPAFAEALGWKEAELLDKPFIELTHPEDRVRTQESFEGVRSGTPVLDFENRYARKDGTYRVFSWRATVDPVTGDVYAVARDITEQRRTEAQLLQSQKMEAVGQLAGGVAHDFNNLLQIILANADLAKAAAKDPLRVQEFLGEIVAAGLRAADLTKQLLAFSRRQPFRPVAVDLNKLTRGLMKMLRRLIPENIDVDFIPGHKLGSVNADPSHLEQVIVNLCVNARDAMERGGQLTIETENVLINGRYCETHPWAKPGRFVLLSVTDTGSGMTPEVQERAFEPFFTTKGPDQGTGLGLSTVYGIVEQHGGLVHVYSEVGQGTAFKIYLPCDDRLAEDVGDKIHVMPPGGQETILLAEDDERVRRAMIQILERAGYKIIAAENGLEALRILRELSEDVHLVILDVVMPDLGGPATWERIQGLRQGLKVMFMSGYADDRYRARLPEGAEVIGKPFRTEMLLERIRHALDG